MERKGHRKDMGKKKYQVGTSKKDDAKAAKTAKAPTMKAE